MIIVFLGSKKCVFLLLYQRNRETGKGKMYVHTDKTSTVKYFELLSGLLLK